MPADPIPDHVAPPPRAEVRRTPGTLTVCDPVLFGAEGAGLTHEFLRRVLAVPAVRSVSVDRGIATSVVRLDGPNPDAHLPGLIAALRAEVIPLDAPSVPRPDVCHGSSWTVFRHRGVLSTWAVMEDAPGRLHIRNPALRRGADRAEAVAGQLRAVAGVRWVGVWRWAASVRISYDPDVLTTEDLLRWAEVALTAAPAAGAVGGAGPRPVQFGLTHTTLGVAALGELALPVLSPVSAALLVGTNVGTFRTAAGQLRRGRFGLPVLYTTIVGATLVSGQFVASALMAWSFKYWGRVGQRDLARERKHLLETSEPSLPTVCRVARRGAEIGVAALRLRRGDVAVVTAGEVVPADGRVVTGSGRIDERGLPWGAGVGFRRAGDPVQAGSLLLAGRMLVTVEHSGASTRGAAVIRALEAVTRPASGGLVQNEQQEGLAGRAVVPTLAAAGLGLLVGGLTTATAVLRPDYATGPGLADPLGVLRDVSEGLRHGLLVRDPGVLKRLTEVDFLVLEDHPTLRRRGLELAIIQTPMPESNDLLRYAASAAVHLADDRAAALAAACRARGLTMLRLDAEDVTSGVLVRHGRRSVRLFDLPADGDPAVPLGIEIDGTLAGSLRFRVGRKPEAAEVVGRLLPRGATPPVLVSDRPADQVTPLAQSLGIARHAAGLTLDEKAQVLDDLRSRGLRTGWVGDARHASRLAPLCHAAVGLAGEFDPELDLDSNPAGVLLLTPRPAPLVDLWAIARAHGGRQTTNRTMILLPNLACVAGAFLLGFGSLAAVIISNLGTLNLYRRTTRWFRRPAHPARLSAPGPTANPTATPNDVPTPAAGGPRAPQPA